MPTSAHPFTEIFSVRTDIPPRVVCALFEDHCMEQGLDIIPEIHLGEKASALEKAGIQSIRGNINREIRKQNAIIMQAKATYAQAKKSLASAKLFSAMAIRKVKNEIIDMIQEVAKRNHDRLKLPVLGTKYLRQVTDRATLQSRERMEQFVHEHELTSFDTLKEYKLTRCAI